MCSLLKTELWAPYSDDLISKSELEVQQITISQTMFDIRTKENGSGIEAG